jgi:hypothetical protein
MDATVFRNLTLQTVNGQAADPTRQTGNLTAWGDVICHGWLETGHIYAPTNANIMIYNNMLPSADNQRFLGNSAYKWQQIHTVNLLSTNVTSTSVTVNTSLNLGSAAQFYDSNGNPGAIGTVLTKAASGRVLWQTPTGSDAGAYHPHNQSLNKTDNVNFNDLILASYLYCSHLNGNGGAVGVHNSLIPYPGPPQVTECNLGSSAYKWDTVYVKNLVCENTGSNGQVLKKTASGMSWQNESDNTGSNFIVQKALRTIPVGQHYLDVIFSTAFTSDPVITVSPLGETDRSISLTVGHLPGEPSGFRTGFRVRATAPNIADHTHKINFDATGFEDRTSPATEKNDPYKEWVKMGEPYVTMDHRHTYLDRYIDTSKSWTTTAATVNNGIGLVTNGLNFFYIAIL